MDQERGMDICFECIFEGKKLFRVLKPESETSLFTGTMPQCQRFLDVYTEKMRKARHRERKSRGAHASR